MTDRDPNNNLNLHAILAKVDEAGTNSRDQQQQQPQEQSEEKAETDDQQMSQNARQPPIPYSSPDGILDEHDESDIIGEDGERMASMPPSSLFAYASGSLNPSAPSSGARPALASSSSSSLDHVPTSAQTQHESQRSLPPNAQQRAAPAGSSRSLFGDASISLNSILDSLPIPGVGRGNRRGSSGDIDVAQGQPEPGAAGTTDASMSGRSHPTSVTNSNSGASATSTGDHGDHANTDTAADDVSNISIPSAILNVKSTNDVKIATYRSKINDLMASHEAESRELRQTIDDLERDNANLTERIDVLLEDIDDKHAISEYAQYITASRANSSSSGSVVAAPESAYVLRLQSQLTKAMHKMGVLSNQIDLLQQQSDDAVANLRDQMMVQANEHAEMERQCLNDLVDMERDMMRMRQRCEEELTKRKEESRTKVHKLKDDARRWRDVAEDLRRDNQALKKAAAKASAAAAKAARKSLEEKDDATASTDSVVSNKMLLDMQMEIIRLKKAHVAEINMLRQQASIKYAGDGSVVSAGAVATVPTEYQGRERSGSVDSDAATATSAATAQVSNVSARDYYHSRGRPVPASIATAAGSAKSFSSSTLPIDEELQPQGKSQEVEELQNKLMELAEHDGPLPMPTIVEAKKKRSTKKMMTSALSNGGAFSSSTSDPSLSASAIVARSRLKNGGGRQSGSIASKAGRHRQESSRELRSTTDESSETAASSRSRHSASRRNCTPGSNGQRAKSRKSVTRPRSVSPTVHTPSNSNIHDFHHSDPSLTYLPVEKTTKDEVHKEEHCALEMPKKNTNNDSKPSAKKLSQGSQGDSPTVPLVTLPDRRSSIGRVA